jgi:Arc/MetJ family transcription regulator
VLPRLARPDSPIHNAGAAQVVDSRAYAIVVAADALAKRTKAYDKAVRRLLHTFGDKLQKAMDRANEALQTGASAV